TAAGITPDDVADTTGTIEAGTGAGVVVVIAQLLAYLWGGYTAGRMARGAGVLNGFLVPLLAIVIAVLVGAVVAALGATANLNLPYSTNRLPLEDNYLIDWGTPVAIAALVAMFIGGALGGGLGAGWHTRLERARDEEIASERAAAAPATATATSRPGDGDGAPTATPRTAETRPPTATQAEPTTTTPPRTGA
ncbi:MAG: hypothetical protein M3161_04600, partial [Actinomycetota bacterium]|nr:hypothetical protein [Actinomycetota bacterium]